MIKVLPGNVYYSSMTILFNPVSYVHTDGFPRVAKILYPSAYNKFREYLNDNQPIRPGDIQLVYLGSNKFMMNGFCIDSKGEMNELALCTNLVELCNLADEYELSVGIQYGLFESDPEESERIKIITRVVFEGMDDLEIEMYEKDEDI